MIVILPAEGEVDPIQQLTPYDEALDQVLTENRRPTGSITDRVFVRS